MGADFTYAIIDRDIASADLHEFVKEMPYDDLVLINSNFYLVADDLPADDDEWSDVMRQALATLVEEAYGAVLSNEVGVLNIEDKTFLLTGGLSWGDPPTDCFQAFAVVEDLQYFYKRARNNEN